MNNRHTGLTAGIKRNLTLTSSILALLLAAVTGQAAVILSITDNDGTPNVGFGDAGQPFSVVVTMTSTELTTGLTYFLMDPGAGVGNVHFQLIGRVTTGTPFSDLNSSNAAVLANGMLDPRTETDLGGTLPDVFTPLGAGSHFIANLTFMVLPTTPNGTYSIGFTPDSAAFGPLPDVNTITITPFSYTVVTPSIPEPVASSLLILGGLFVGARARVFGRR